VIADIARNPTPAAQKRRDLGTPVNRRNREKQKPYRGLTRINADQKTNHKGHEGSQRSTQQSAISQNKRRGKKAAIST
jgi:hypothetical protein